VQPEVRSTLLVVGDVNVDRGTAAEQTANASGEAASICRLNKFFLFQIVILHLIIVLVPKVRRKHVDVATPLVEVFSLVVAVPLVGSTAHFESLFRLRKIIEIVTVGLAVASGPQRRRV